MSLKAAPILVSRLHYCKTENQAEIIARMLTTVSNGVEQNPLSITKKALQKLRAEGLR